MINILSLTHSAIKMNEEGYIPQISKTTLKEPLALHDSKCKTFWKGQNYGDISGCQGLGVGMNRQTQSHFLKQ